jgi:hypothetical protein
MDSGFPPEVFWLPRLTGIFLKKTASLSNGGKYTIYNYRYNITE